MPTTTDTDADAAPSHPIFSVADVMPELLASLQRTQAKWRAYCDTLAPRFAALPDTQPCPLHPDIARAKLFEETCQHSRQAGEFTPRWARCPRCDDAAETERQHSYWRRRGIAERVLHATFDNFVVAGSPDRAEALRAARHWLRRRGAFLLLRGTPGTGKGHLASACLQALGEGRFLTHADMLQDLRASYTLHTTPELVARWQDAPCLVLDEFGLSPGGADEAPMLYQVLAKRYDHRRPTILTTNLDRSQFRTMLGDRLLDRLGEDCTVIDCVWESWRTRG